MKLFSYWRSSCSWRVRIVLNLKGVEYDLRPVDIAPAVQAQHGAEHRERNPMAQVPTLEWRENGQLRRLSQSVAIAEYLEERFRDPPLLPVEPYERARTREAVEIVNAGIQPFQNSGTLARVTQLAGETNMRAWAGEFIERGLGALETMAGRTASKHFMGDRVSLADAFLVPQLYNARRFEVDVAQFPTLLRIEQHASALSAFERAHPSVQPDCPDRQPS